VVHDLIVRTNACHTSSRSRATMIRARTVCDVAWTGSELRRAAIPIPYPAQGGGGVTAMETSGPGDNGRRVEGRRTIFFDPGGSLRLPGLLATCDALARVSPTASRGVAPWTDNHNVGQGTSPVKE
jgi:hypothetical protein